MENLSGTSEGLEFVELQEGFDENVDISNLYLVGKILAPKTLNKSAVTNINMGARKPRANMRHFLDSFSTK
ncbi:hypothetical protein ACSBR1_007352 [Camellia fascicularis]